MNSNTTKRTKGMSKVLGWLVAASCWAGSAQAALSLDKTRYIFNGNEKAINLLISNTEKETYGGQIWLENVRETDSRPSFIAAPSFFKVKGASQQSVRILQAFEHLPQHMESVYWLNLQELPPAREGSGLTVAVRSRVKVFYRPVALLDERKGAEQRIRVQQRPEGKALVNDTPYIFAITALLDAKGNKLTPKDPKASETLQLFMPGDSVDVTGLNVAQVASVNDFGVLDTWSLTPANAPSK